MHSLLDYGTGQNLSNREIEQTEKFNSKILGPHVEMFLKFDYMFSTFKKIYIYLTRHSSYHASKTWS